MMAEGRQRPTSSILAEIAQRRGCAAYDGRGACHGAAAWQPLPVHGSIVDETRNAEDRREVPGRVGRARSDLAAPGEPVDEGRAVPRLQGRRSEVAPGSGRASFFPDATWESLGKGTAGNLVSLAGQFGAPMADEDIEITTSVIDAILGARASGGRLSVEGDNLFLETPKQLPDVVLNQLKLHKRGVRTLLRLGWWGGDWQSGETARARHRKTQKRRRGER
jgi:hypothetical protein